MRRRALLLILLAALALTGTAVAGPLKAIPDGSSLVLTTKKAQPLTMYAATCEATGQIIGTSAWPSSATGRVTVQVLLPLPPGPYVCWLRTDLTSSSGPPAHAVNGRPLRVTGTAAG
jgi:hypothetical protein